MSTEVIILQERASKLEQMVELYTTKYKLLASKHESSEELIKQQKLEIKQLQDMCEDYSAKYDEIVSKNDILTVKHQFGHQSHAHNTNLTSDESSTITQLKQQLEAAKNQIKAKERLIDQKRQIIDSIEYHSKDSLRYKNERDNLQEELNSFAEMAQQDLMYQKEQIEKLQSEVMMLAERNISLEKEKDDILQLLEERDYENQMLKTAYNVNKAPLQHLNMSSQQPVQTESLGFYGSEFLDKTSQEVMLLSTRNSALEEERDQLLNMLEYTSAEYAKQKKKPEKQVADVTREYLHLTASVVSIKFPKVQHIPSEELINKVKNHSFWEYHDMMVRIMKTEENKMNAKEKAEREQKREEKVDANAMNQVGVLGRFRNFFGGAGTDGTQKLNVNTRQRNKIGSNRQQGSGSTTNKKAPNIEDAKKKFKETQKTVKNLKDVTVKKIRNKPSEEESAKMANMSFASVPAFGGYDDGEKVNKPKQGL